MKNDDIKKIFGNNIKRLRELKGYSQEKLAEMVGIGIPALSNIECGKSYPLETTFEKFVEVFDIEPCLLYVNEKDYNLEKAYKDMLLSIDKLKSDKVRFKMAYDFVKQLTQNL